MCVREMEIMMFLFQNAPQMTCLVFVDVLKILYVSSSDTFLNDMNYKNPLGTKDKFFRYLAAALDKVLSHYENTSIQIYRKFHFQKAKIFRKKKTLIFFIFLLKT